MTHRLPCSVACGIFLDQGLNPCLQHWQADSLPLSHQGSPLKLLLSFPKFVGWPGNRTARSKDLSLSRMETAFRCGGRCAQQRCLSPFLVRLGKIIPPNRASWRTPQEVLLSMVQDLLFSAVLSPLSGDQLNTSGNDEGPSEMRQW